MGKIARLRLKGLNQDIKRLDEIEEEEMRFLVTDYSRKDPRTVDGINETEKNRREKRQRRNEDIL